MSLYPYSLRRGFTNPLLPRTRTARPQPIRPRQVAEWQPARTVLLCEPNVETLFALLEGKSANFLRPFSLAAARRDHRRYREQVEATGATVLDLREALARGAHREGEALDRLRSWARGAVSHRFEDGFPQECRESVRQDFESSLTSFDAEMLVDLILLRPTITVGMNPEGLDATTCYKARYEVAPAHNNYYTRDPLITTARGCVVGRLSLEIRQPENDIAQYALAQLGIEPVCRVQAPGTLEGGDFIPCGDFALQGQGLLTNEEGVRQVLAAGGYGFVEVGVVKDPRSLMDEMHLDTYFAVLDRDLCAICEDRAQPDQEPVVDVWEPVGTPENFAHRLVRTVPFLEYLRSKGMKVLTFTKAEQEGFAPNGLLVSPRTYLAVKGCGDGFAAKLRAENVEIRWLDFHSLTGGYGGPHCSSQVLVRGGESPATAGRNIQTSRTRRTAGGPSTGRQPDHN